MDEVFGSSYYKTKICINIIKNNTCKREKCFFAHSQDELREKPDLGKTKLCVKILKKGGKCTDENCTYAHSKDQLKTDNYKGLIKTKKCWFHAKNCCSNADKCRFAHGDDELRVFSNETGSETDLNYRNVESMKRKIKPFNSLCSAQIFTFPPPPPPPVDDPSPITFLNSSLLQNDISDESQKSSIALHHSADSNYKNWNISKNNVDNEQRFSIDFLETEHSCNANDLDNVCYNLEKDNYSRTNDSNVDTTTSSHDYYNNNLTFMVMNTTSCKQKGEKNTFARNYDENNHNRNTENDVAGLYDINCFKTYQNEYCNSRYSDNAVFYVPKLSSIELSNDCDDENVLEMNINQNINVEQDFTINQQKQIEHKEKCDNSFINSFCKHKDLNKNLTNLNSNSFLSKNKIKAENFYNLSSLFTSSDNKCTCTFLSGSLPKIDKAKEIIKNDNNNSSIFEIDNFINSNDNYYIDSKKVSNNFFFYCNEYNVNKNYNDSKVNDVILQNNDMSYFPQNTFDELSSCNLSSSLSNFLFSTSSGVCSGLSSSVSSPSLLFNSEVMYKFSAKEQEDICDKIDKNLISYEKTLENSLDTSLNKTISENCSPMVTHNTFSTLPFSSLLTHACSLTRNSFNLEEEQYTMNSLLQNSYSSLLSMPYFCAQSSCTSLIDFYSSVTSESSSNLASSYLASSCSELNQSKTKKSSKVLSSNELFSEEKNNFLSHFCSDTSLLCENRDNLEHLWIKENENIEEEGSINLRNGIISTDQNYLQKEQDTSSLIPTDAKHEICDFSLPFLSHSSVCATVINNYNNSSSIKRCDSCTNNTLSPSENDYLNLDDIITYNSDYDGNLFFETPIDNMVYEEENDTKNLKTNQISRVYIDNKLKFFANILDPLSQYQNCENSIENPCNNKGNMCLNCVQPSIICDSNEKTKYFSLIDNYHNDNTIVDCGIDVKLENNICGDTNTKIVCESNIMLPPTAVETFMLDNVKLSFSSVSSSFLFTSLSNSSVSSSSSPSSLLPLSPTLMKSFPLQTPLLSSPNLFKNTFSFTDKFIEESIADKLSIPYTFFELNSSSALISSSLSNYFSSPLALSKSFSTTSQVSEVFSSPTIISSSVHLSDKLSPSKIDFPFSMSSSFSECLSYNSTRKSSLQYASQLNNLNLDPENKLNMCTNTCNTNLSKYSNNNYFVEHEMNYGCLSNILIDGCQSTQLLNNGMCTKNIADGEETEKIGKDYYNDNCKNNTYDALKDTLTCISKEKDVLLNNLKFISDNEKSNIVQTHLTELNGNKQILIDKNEHFSVKDSYQFKKKEANANMNYFMDKSNISDSILHSCYIKSIERRDESGKENNKETEFLTSETGISTESLRNYSIKKEVVKEFCENCGAANDTQKLINNAKNILLLQRNEESNSASRSYEDLMNSFTRKNSFINVDANLSSTLTTENSSSSSFLNLNNFEVLNDQKNKTNAEIMKIGKTELTNSLKDKNSISIASTNPCSPSMKEESEFNFSRLSNVKYMSDTEYSIKDNEIIDVERNNTKIHLDTQECYSNIDCSVVYEENNSNPPSINEFSHESIIDTMENEDFKITRGVMICENFEYKSNIENNNKSYIMKYNTVDDSKMEQNNDIDSNKNNEDYDCLETINNDYYIFLLNSQNYNNTNVDVNYFSKNISLNYSTDNKDKVNSYFLPDYSKKTKYYYDYLFEDNGKSDNCSLNESLTNFKNLKFQKAGYNKVEKDKNFNLYFLPKFLLD